MLTNSQQDVCAFFFDPSNNRLADSYRQVLSSTLLHAPVQYYVVWIANLRQVCAWNDSALRAELSILDGAILQEFPKARATDRWQECAVLVTHLAWVVGTNSTINPGISSRFAARSKPDADQYQPVLDALSNVYDDAARRTLSGPCAFFYLAQAASLIPGVVTNAKGALQLYLRGVDKAVSCTAVILQIADHPDDLPKFAAELETLENRLRASAGEAAQEIKAIEDAITAVSRRRDEMAKEVGALQTANPADLSSQLASLQARMSEALAVVVADTPVLRFLQRRLAETRQSLEEKAEFVRGVRLNARSYARVPRPAYAPYRRLLMFLNGNPKRMTPRGWLRFLNLFAGLGFFVGAGAILINHKRPPPSPPPESSTQPPATNSGPQPVEKGGN